MVRQFNVFKNFVISKNDWDMLSSKGGEWEASHARVKHACKNFLPNFSS